MGTIDLLPHDKKEAEGKRGSLDTPERHETAEGLKTPQKGQERGHLRLGCSLNPRFENLALILGQ